MKKVIKILAGYAIFLSIFIIVTNFFVLGREVRVTPERFLFTCLTLLPIIVFAILVLIYNKKSE